MLHESSRQNRLGASSAPKFGRQIRLSIPKPFSQNLRALNHDAIALGQLIVSQQHFVLRYLHGPFREAKELHSLAFALNESNNLAESDRAHGQCEDFR